MSHRVLLPLSNPSRIRAGVLTPVLPRAALVLAACLGASLAASAAGAAERWLHTFERTQLSDVFTCEGATFGDLTGDGVNDIVAGPYWYQGPDFKQRHEYYPVKTFDPKGYSDNFFAWVLDFNADTRNDILIIGFPGQDASWFENPGRPGVHWKRHVVFDTVDNESPTFTDITGDGRAEIVCSSGGRYGYASPDWSRPAEKWKFTAIGEDRKLGRFTHGMGVGDVSGDGRMDLLEKDGWYEQPASLAGEPLWKWHRFTFTGPGGAQMYAYDIDGDGDNDVITSLRAHARGFAWFEHVREGDEIAFKPHLILDLEDKPFDALERSPWQLDFSQLHALDLVDMDGDGLLDIVTGKRWQAHWDEPGAGDPALVYWFRLTRDGAGEGAKKVEFVPYLIDDASGIGTQVVAGDVNGDGLHDVVVGNKKGVFYLEHSRRRATEDEWRAAQPARKVAFSTDALSPAEAVARMSAPAGFRVDLVAAEPDIHQPVAFAFDERGRIWVAEGHTYPLRAKGDKGRWDEGADRIVILADEDGDGRFESRKTFIENVNLVSGLETGFGGVWVGAAPYLLFFPDRDRDDRPDGPPEILLDGFGFHDTHETLNSFIWGPDGWLYGCHGVFTHSRVGKPGTPDADRVPLNAGYWRYHPTKRRFEVFAWGTSNPWGIDFNDRGQAFATACVIPHLYHVIQGARYQRQAGRHFDDHVYADIRTIADHAHYAGDIRDHAWWGHEPIAAGGTLEAGGGHAHCGALVYLGDNFPPEYRDRLFMNNIHGNRVNTDVLEPRGSGYLGRHGKDLLLANNLWFRGIALKTGPDGAVYVSDWYDRNACHRTQPLIWDRTNGRIFRVSYGSKPAPARAPVDIARLDDAALAGMQLHANEYHVRAARRVLQERGGSAAARAGLLAILRDNPDTTRKLRALWALRVAGGVGEELALELLHAPDPYVRAWTIQLLAEDGAVPRKALDMLANLAHQDPSAVVRLYLASALQRLPIDDRRPIARGLIAHAEDAEDHNLPLLIWYGIEPLAAADRDVAMELAGAARIQLLARHLTRRVAADVGDLEPLMGALARSADEASTRLILEEMLRAFEGHVDIAMPRGWSEVYDKLIASASEPVRELARAAAVRFGDRRVFPLLRRTAANAEQPLDRRKHALEVLIAGRDAELAPLLLGLLDDAALRLAALRALAAYEHPGVPAAIVERYGALRGDERIAAVQTLISRPAYAIATLEAVRAGSVPGKDLDAFAIRQLRSFGDERVNELIAAVWGQARETDADKKARIDELTARLAPAALAGADKTVGRGVFSRICAQCHRLFGAGAEIAPDITGSNRADLAYILENLVDPNAVVGKDYQMELVALEGGRFVTGLVTGETESALSVRTITEGVVLPKKEILSRHPSTSSLMPEGLLDDLTAAELRGLIAYLASPTQVFLPGAELRVDPKTHRAAGALEGEDLEVLERGGGSTSRQDMTAFGRDKWSDNAQLWWTGAKPGQRLVLSFPVERAGTWAVDVVLTKARDYGIVQLFIDDAPVEAPIDLFNDPAVISTGSLRLGELALSAGPHRLGVEIRGAHPKAVQAFMFGLDCILLEERK